MSNLAPPALRASAARADKAEYAEPATAYQVQQSEPVRVSSVEVDPAVPFDDPARFAPPAPKPNAPSAISVAALRGGAGAAFEGYAAVLRGAPEKNILKVCFPCIYDERDFVTYGECKKYTIIKGGNCFVFGEEHSPSPLYAIPLDEVYAIQEDSNNLDKYSVTVSPLPNSNKPRPEMVTILLKYRRDNSQAYQFTFDTSKDASMAKRFLDAVEQASEKGGAVTASVVRADQVGERAKQAQPAI